MYVVHAPHAVSFFFDQNRWHCPASCRNRTQLA